MTPRYAKALALALLILAGTGSVAALAYVKGETRTLERLTPSLMGAVSLGRETRRDPVGSGCTKTHGVYDCTSEEIKQRLYENAKAGIRWYDVDERPETITARVTKYSRRDSCHNPKGTLCLTASGTDTKENYTAACPPHLAFGTRITIGGVPYVCLDRTAMWVQKRAPTFDIFTESYAEAKAFGVKKMQVTIL